MFTVHALQMQLAALHALEHDAAFNGKAHKKRRKTIRNQMDKIKTELRIRQDAEECIGESVMSIASGSGSGSSGMGGGKGGGCATEESDASDSKRHARVVGGIWGL
jgi:hypothetical protein